MLKAPMALRLLPALILIPQVVISAATITYSYQDLGVLPFTPAAVNNRGWIAGTGYVGPGPLNMRPFRYRPGVGSEQLSDRPGVATDVNDAGTIGGYLLALYHGYSRWHASLRPAGEPWERIGPISENTYVRSLNEAGQAVVNFTSRASLYTPGSGLQLLDTLGGTVNLAYSINELGQVLGMSYVTGVHDQHTFLWDPFAGLTDITALADPVNEDFEGLMLSDSGIVMGRTERGMAVYSPSLGLRRPEGLGGAAGGRAINDRGWVVGESSLSKTNTSVTRAFLYVYGRGITDLNALTPGLDTVLKTAIDINDRDQILALGQNGHHYLLSRSFATSSLALKEIDNPEPSSYLLSAAGLALVMFYRKRRCSRFSD